jgi:HTH-type transcriptional regulator/antitoxin HigA
MTIKPIRTEHDHLDALARVDEIFSARPGTREFDELDVLATLIEAYERIHHQIDPPSPLEAIRFRMEQGSLARSSLDSSEEEPRSPKCSRSGVPCPRP